MVVWVGGLSGPSTPPVPSMVPDQCWAFHSSGFPPGVNCTRLAAHQGKLWTERLICACFLPASIHPESAPKWKLHPCSICSALGMLKWPLLARPGLGVERELELIPVLSFLPAVISHRLVHTHAVLCSCWPRASRCPWEVVVRSELASTLLAEVR